MSSTGILNQRDRGHAFGTLPALDLARPGWWSAAAA